MWTYLKFLLIASNVHSLIQPTRENLNANIVTDFDSYDFPQSTSSELLWYHITGNYTSTNREYSAFVAIFNPSHFAFFPPTTNGCDTLIKPTESSYNTYACDYATNGAFFWTDGNHNGALCKGNLISEGKVWQLPTDGTGTGRANIGLAQGSKLITGFLDADVISQSNFSNLITGWGWLVRKGESFVAKSADLSFQPGGFTYQKAPRTSIGHFKNGTMILLEIDGEEDIEAGPDLFEVAELLVSLGVESAVNIDGGGSSVAVYKGEVIDKPTCKDTPVVCERAVASIACVKASA